MPDPLSQELLEEMVAIEAQEAFAHIPISNVNDIAAADGIIFDTPTRFRNMYGQMGQFMDRTGMLWS